MAKADMFLKVEGIDGESRDEAHKSEIDIFSYDFGVLNSGSVRNGDGSGGLGKAALRDLKITKKVDNASPGLFAACCTNRHFSKVILTVRKAGENPLEYLVVTLYDAFVSDFSSSGDSGGDIGVETVAFSFSKVEKKYTPQTEKGAKGAVNTKTFDIKLNRLS